MGYERGLSVSFDEYQRYNAVSLLVNHFRQESLSAVFRILEIGSNEAKHLRGFLPDDDILFTDIKLTESMKQDPEFQIADGTDLPFEDGSFDFVVATDVLEHVPRDRRSKLLSEAYRVAKYSAIITFPQMTHDVLAAEEHLNTYHQALHGEEFIWLKEHREYGLPSVEEVDSALNEIGCSFFRIFHGDIRLWEKLYYSVFDSLGVYAEWDFRKQIDFFYIRELYPGDVSESCYRAIYVLSHVDIESQQHALKSEVKQIADEKFAVLDMLLSAQRQIHWKCAETSAQKELASKNEHIARLEAHIQQVESRWKTDVERWEEDVARWQADVRQWESDVALFTSAVEQHRAESSQQAELIAVMEEQRVQAEQLAEQLCRDLSISGKKLHDAIDVCDGLRQQLDEAQIAYNEISNAFFWKMTKPLRAVLDLVKKSRRN